jgi:formate-dependent nitrite reductase membrane component NrfD
MIYLACAFALTWLALGTVSLACTLATDGPPLPPTKVVAAYTLGPIAIVVGAVVLVIDLLRKPRHD